MRPDELENQILKEGYIKVRVKKIYQYLENSECMADNIPDNKEENSSCYTDVGRILRTFKIKKNVEVTDNGKIII